LLLFAPENTVIDSKPDDSSRLPKWTNDLRTLSNNISNDAINWVISNHQPPFRNPELVRKGRRSAFYRYFEHFPLNSFPLMPAGVVDNATVSKPGVVLTSTTDPCFRIREN